MSLLKANSVQIGQSVTATQNFTLSVPSSPDGTIKLARGNSGATTADVLSVASNGRITMPTPPLVSAPAFAVALNANQTISNTTYTKIGFDVVSINPTSGWTGSNTFQPNVNGYYYIYAQAQFSFSSASQVVIRINRNGNAVWYNTQVSSLASGAIYNVSNLVQLNGSTDYLQIDGYISGTGTLSFTGGQSTTLACGYLVAPL
jgi:hypothetical protein